MQEMINKNILADIGLNEARKQKKTILEYFQEMGDEALFSAMDKRAKELKNSTIIVRKRIGRNEKCPCGSGKKFKKCCIDKISTTTKISTKE